MWTRTFAFAAVLCLALLLGDVIAYGKFGQMSRRKQQRAADAVKLEERGSYPSSNRRFYTQKTAPYFIDHLPDVNFDLGEFYGGNIPIDNNDKNRTLFFLFKPTTGPPCDDITIWLNGGPGCSSLEGFFQENGFVTWQAGTYAPQPNPYAWSNLTNMIWVEQPVGTGFATGKVTAQSEEDIAKDFADFFKNFEQLFGIKNYRIQVTGESYAGRYVPYISAEMLNRKNKEYFNLDGALVYDPCIGAFDYSAEQAFTYPFVKENNNYIGLNDSALAQLESLHKSCGYEQYVDKYLTFPPPGHQPVKPKLTDKCDVFDYAINAILEVNPCFDPYEAQLQCPLLWDVLSFPTILVYQPPGSPQTYFNRPDVKKAIHAPANVDWAECANDPVFIGGKNGRGGPEGEGDLSADPIQHVLPQVIEATNRVLVSNGDLDMIIISDGTLISIQNMTWGGKLGFQQKPSTPIVVQIPDLMYASVFAENGAAGLDGPQGTVGVQHFERGLMWTTAAQSGHMQPQYQPRKTYRDLQWVLRRINSL